jgi:two-component system, NarL family, sensor histidine kinase DesK
MCAALAGIASAIGGAVSGAAIGYSVSAIGIGLLMVLVRDLRTRNDELSEARAELARLAVAEERERFARDLHDLLGHSLSVIALKAELAGRLLPERPGEAADQVAELEQVARGALTEVREAVSGYRQPTLDGELAGARMALSAAGIEADVERSPVTLDPDVEALLAWTVREGATNVIRHSGARRCTVRIGAGLSEATVEVLDDGVGADGGAVDRGAANGSGHGLVGLAERAAVLSGSVEAESLPSGGFRLRVTVPRGRLTEGRPGGAPSVTEGRPGGASSVTEGGPGGAPSVTEGRPGGAPPSEGRPVGMPPPGAGSAGAGPSEPR